jgi:hypothetical protein
MPKGAPGDHEALGSFRPPADHTAAADAGTQLSAIVLNFDPSTQELGPLLEAAYCLMPQASCHIDSSRDRYLCRLVPKSTDPTDDALKERFLELVTDANLRGRVPFHALNSSRG